MRVHFIIHEAFEGPGALALWTLHHGYTSIVTRLYEHDPLPSSLDKIDMLIVMGGPQSPATTQEECPHFDSLAEQALIREAIAAGKAVLGICLGAQLIGAALGAPYEHSPEPEIGKYLITLTETGRRSANLAAFGSRLEVGHWHNDMPGLTPQATILATSAGCPRQIVQYAPLVFGFQCHLEFTRDLVELLIDASQMELRQLADRPFVQPPETLRAHDYRDMNTRMFAFLDCLVSQISPTQS
ncbi:gamma-glutamyl-gamma-aminobutyrate hydrolase family protein [Asaia siamensis]